MRYIRAHLSDRFHNSRSKSRHYDVSHYTALLVLPIRTIKGIWFYRLLVEIPTRSSQSGGVVWRLAIEFWTQSGMQILRPSLWQRALYDLRLWESEFDYPDQSQRGIWGGPSLACYGALTDTTWSLTLFRVWIHRDVLWGLLLGRIRGQTLLFSK